ncbi:MAG TPA: asparaginase [Hyphomicrobiaceae bacterium]|nr:asparaginase [Hyphomicrobiaceae bacterium]
MRNPVLIELTRGQRVESRHTGAIALVRASGEIVASIGDVDTPVFPRSAIKPLQAIPCIETGAADRFGFGSPEIALASASHSGTPEHAALAQSMLERAGLTVGSLACGAHEPLDVESARALVRASAPATALHHNCSGKHAAMLVTAVHAGEPTEGYWHHGHPVQVRIARVLEDLTGQPMRDDVRGIDGCGVPNWAIPLRALAQAWARFATGTRLAEPRAQACHRIAGACWHHPELVAGAGRLDSAVMGRLNGTVLLKAGAEGVYCGALAELEVGFALKIDDGAKRAAETAALALITRIYPAAAGLGPATRLTNWSGVETGSIQPASALDCLLAQID